MDREFRIKSKVDGDTTFVDIGGSIDEKAQFGDLKVNSKVTVNLEKVAFINSVGTRAWCLWIQRFRAPIEVTLVRCPAILVKSFNSVKGFLTPQCQVQSFFVPFYSDETGERKDVLLVRGTHFSGPTVQLPEVLDQSGRPMEMDVVPELYFTFLKAQDKI
jgi:hypothetical protein